MNIHPLTSSYHQCIVFLIFFESLFLGGFGHAVTRDAALPDPPATAFTNTAQASEAVAGSLQEHRHSGKNTDLDPTAFSSSRGSCHTLYN
jgi:hypothetical protein